jgi:hypothetical protein
MIIGAALFGCAPKKVTCLPPQAAVPGGSWSINADPTAKLAAAKVYLDKSVSMKGFIPASRVVHATKDPIFLAFIRDLPDDVDKVSDYKPLDFGFFGSEQETVSVDRDEFEKEATSARAYTFTKTDIPAVLGKIRATSPNELAIVITDLFFNNKELGSGGTGRIVRALRDLTDQGRSIAVVALSSPFDGRVLDIPPDGDELYYRGIRPAFALIIGPAMPVEHLVSALQRDLLVDRPQGSFKTVLFTSNPLQLKGFELSGKSLDSGDAALTAKGTARDLLLDRGGLLIWQGIISIGASGRAPALTVSLSRILDGYLPDAMRPTEKELNKSVDVRLFRYAGSGVSARCEKLWEAVEVPRGFASVTHSSDLKMGLDILSDRARSQLERGRLYYAELDIKVPSVTADDLPAWISTTSYDDARAQQLLSAGRRELGASIAVFPVYKLDRLAGALATQPEQSADSRGVLGRLRFAFKLER